jgi:hypothetical protein
MHRSLSQFLPRSVAGAALFALVLSMIFVMGGCGDGHQTQAAVVPTPTPAAPTSTVQVRVGDAPADQLLNFEATIVSPIVATLSSGDKVKATLADNRIELSHMAGKMEPLLNLSLPQGTYKSVDITIADPAITYIYTPVFESFGSKRDGQHQLVSRDFPGNQTVTLNFDPAITFGANASVVSLDVNLAKALIFNPDDSQEIMDVKFTPESLVLVQKAIAAADKQQHMDGELESVTGTVTAVNGNNFTISAGQSGALLTVSTTSTTQFHDSVKGVADMVNRLVEVEGYTQADGTMIATEVDGLVSNKGASMEGVILDAGDSLIDMNILGYGHQRQSFTMITQDATGNGTKMDDLGWTFTIHTNYLTDVAYTVDYGKCDWSSLNTDVPGPLFPFDSRHLFPGQRVSVVTDSALPGADFTHFTATGIELEQQAVTGEIVFYQPINQNTATEAPPSAGAWFVLHLPEDSYVRSLSGREYVLVYQGPATDVEFLSSNTDKLIGEGTIARVRGLMFAFSNWYPKGASAVVSTDGQVLTMISRRITEIESAAPQPSLAK